MPVIMRAQKEPMMSLKEKLKMLELDLQASATVKN